ncbi:MAG: hypothetical protein KBT11_06355, partial [Treponema sp.]|nr:hypothetical protein [Candidatus Treponema equifaecale]
MRKFNKITKKIAVAAAGFATLFAVAACSDVGLGHAVDTIAPTVDITYPPAAAIVRDSFILAGTWTDDNAVTSINITVENIDSKESFNVPATINQDKTWQVEINGYDDEKKCFSLIDGTYQLNAIGTDAAGRKSGVASRQFEIDNSAPLFVVSNPGVVKKSGKSPSSYGSFFNIVGRIAEAHDVASMNLDVFDGNTDEKLNSEVYIEKGIQTAGGTDVTIAAFNYAADTDAKRRFSQIYGTEDTLGTKNYYCSVDLYDSAKAFKNPKETERSAEDDLGNHTTEIYLFDEVNSDLVSPTKGLGYSYTQLMQIKNGTLVDKNSEAVLEILKKRSRNTEKADERLYFSLNPLANPTYTINGFAYDFGEGKQLQSASSGNSLSITLQAGLDGNNIDPSVAKVWLLSLDERPYDSNVIRSKIKNLETQVNSSDLDPESGESYKVCEYDGAGKPTGTVIEGWGLIYNNADYNGSSVSQTTFSVKLPESSIKLNKYYFVAVTGCDVEDVFFSIDAQNTFFGFEGNEAGIAPTVEIKSPANQSIVSASDAENLKFTGKVYVNSESIYAQKFDVKIVAKDESDNSEVGTVEAKISRNDPSGEWTSSDAVAIDSDGNWTIVPEKFEGYSKIAAAKDSGKSYLYTLEITAESSSGHNITVSSMVKIDAVAPVVTITSLTPTVSGAEYYAGAPESDPRTKKIFVNGNISITGNIVETNLKNVRYDVWARVVGTGNGEVLSEKDSVLKAIEDYLIYKGDLGKVFSKTVELPTNAITWHFAKEDNTDPEIEFEVVIYAEDECGNSGEFHTSQLNEGEYYVIKQETDKPVITLGNSSNSELFASGASNINEINGNLFGTTSNNKLSISFADDDSIKEYIVTIYNEAGEKIGEDKLGEGVESNPLTIPSGKTSASLNYVLPAIEGVYQIEIQAKDGKYLKKEADGTWKYEDGSGFVNNTEEEVKKLNENRLSTTEKYFIAVSKGAPKVTITTTKAYLSATPTISGTVESSAKKITAVFINPETEEVDSQPATVQPVINGTSWTYTIPSASSLNNASYAIKFTSEDAYGQKDSSSIKFQVDDKKPTLEITSYNSKPVVEADKTAGVKFYVIPQNIYVVKGTYSDKDESGKEGSGVEAVYYCVGTVPEGKVSATWSLASLTNDGWTVSLTDLNSDSLSIKDGSAAYKLHVKAIDKAGNESDSAEFIDIYPDENAPAVTVKATAESGKAIYDETPAAYTNDLAFGKTYYSTGTYTLGGKVTENALQSFKINGSDVAVGTDGTWNYTPTLAEDSSVTYTFTAIDKAGNSFSNSVVIQKDTTAPVVKLATPKENGLIGNSDMISGTVSDAFEVEKVSYSIKKDGTEISDGSGYVTIGSDNSSWTIPSLRISSEGTFTIEFTGTDKLGNTSTSSPVIFYYDAASPAITEAGETTRTVNSNYKLSGTVVESNGLKEITIKDSFGNASPVTLSATASGNGFRLKTGSTDTYDWEYNLTVSDETNGTHIYTITATDVTENSQRASNIITKTVNVDTNAPEISAVTDKANVYLDVSNYVSISAKAGDESTNGYASGLTGVYYIVTNSNASVPGYNGTNWAAMAKGASSYSANFDITKLSYLPVNSDATLYVYIAAVDNAGNSTVYAKPAAITVDKSAPSIEVEGDLNIQTNVTSITKTVVVKDTNLEDSTPNSTAIALTYVSDESNLGAVPTITFVKDVTGGKEYSVKFTAKNDGSESVVVLKATDANERESKTAKLTAKCDLTAPVVNIAEPASAASTTTIYKNSSNVTVKGSVEENNLKDVKVYLLKDDETVSTLADDNRKVDARTVGARPKDDGTKVNDWTANFVNIADGEYKIVVVASDTYTNSKTETVSYKYVVDMTAPVVNSPVYLKLAETEKKVLNSAYAEQSAVTNGFAVENGKTYYTNGTYTLSGTVTETNFSKVTVKAGDNTPVDKTTATWEFTPSSYEEKSVLYTITATDLAGNIGTYTVYVVYDKTAPEEVAISAPAENDYVESKAISISGTASDNGVGIASVTYTIKKGETQLATNSINVSGGRWSASNISLTGLSDEGSCTLLIDAQDRLGNSIDQLTREFSFDSAAPVVTQTNNADYATVKDFVLEGKITENNGLSAADSIVIKEGSTIIATIPSSSITGTKPNYSWTYTFPETGSVATEGKHTYTIIAKDIAGRTSSVTKEITVDTEKPTVTTVPYTTATVVNYDSSTYVLLNANATDETSKVAAVYYAVTNSTTAPAFKATTAGTTGDNWSVMARTASGYTATANLAELNGGSGITSDSAWYVHIKAVDGAGLVSTETTYGTLNVDIHKPVVTVAEGTSIKSKTTDTNLTVNFADTNPRTVYYTINGGDEKSVSLVDGKFDVPITGMRADGTETNVVVYGKDENNRKSDNVNVSITCDTTNPVVEITSPATDSYLSSSTVTVKGTVVEKNMESLKVSLMKNDSEAYSGSANLTKGQGDNYTWSVTLNGVDDGAYTIKAMATDQYGNNEGTAIKSISSIIDTVAPAVENLTVSSESVNIESQNSAFVVTVSVSDATSGIADTEGVVLYDGSERLGKMTEDGAVYKYTIAEADLLTVLSTGAHTLTVHAKDKAGNENNSVSKTISSDVTAPTLKISGVSPTVTQGDTVYVNGKITVSGNATDETSLGETLTWKIKDGSGTDEGTSGTVDVSGTYATWNFTVDTTKLTDNSDYTIEVSVADKAGNKPDSTDSSANTLKWGIKVNQTTDKPVLALTSASEKFAQFSEINGTEKDGQTNILALSGKLTGTVSDDDGISSIVVTVTPEKGSETNYKLVEDGTSTNVSINKTLSELGITAEGAYEINISVTDTKNETKNSSIESNFVVAADNGAPTLAITSPNNGGYYNNSFAVAGTVTDGSGTVVLTASNVSDKEVSGFTKNKTTFTGTSTAQALSDTVKVKDLADKTSDGGYTLTYTATDRWGQSSSANVMFYKDGKPPVLDNENTSVGGVKTMVAVSGDTENNVAPSWFKDESIKIDGEITESGSGIETVYYWLNKTADTTNLSTASGSANAKNLGSGNWSYSMTISGFYAKSSEMLPANANFNTLTIVAVDFAGNVSNLLSYNVRLDSTKPTLTDGSVKVGFEEDPTTGTASFLANGEKDIYISGEISDEENGSGIDKVIILPFGSTSYDENTDKAVVAEGKFKFTIPNTKVTQSGSVFARIYDVAGNYNDVNLFTITYDNKAPSVVLNKPADADTSTDELELNGTISLAGTASDDYTVSKIEKIQYVKSETAPTSDTTWSDLTGVTITGEYSFTVTGFDTTKLTDGNYYLRAVGVDTAENIGYSDPVKVKIDQDSDRPKIKITNLTGSNGNYNLRQGTRSRISGTVTDDDGIEEFYISESPFTGTGDKPETSTYSSNSGSFTFNPSADVTAKKNVDGEKTVYIYVKDKAGGVFYTTAYIDETAAAAAKYLKNPKIFLNDTAIAETENAKVFKYFSDSISPIVGTVTGLAYKADGTTINAAYNEETGSFDKAEDVNASFIIGGTERQKAKFTIKASDANGIAGMALEISYKAKDGTDKKIIRATAEKLGEDTFTTEQVKGDFTGTGTNNSSDATWTTDLISFEDAATGNATLKVVPYDNSGLSGNGNLSFAIDMTGPTIKVTSPSSTEQVSGSTIPVSGIATDAGGSTTDSIKWYVPKADENMKVAGAFTTLDSTFLASSFDSKWSGELTTTSSNSAWTFNFDGNNNSSFSEFVNGGTISGYYSANDDGIVSIPVYFKSTDKHGNATLYRDFAILYNPDADRPLVTITYPSEADYKEGEKFAILGGTIRSTGTVEIPDGSTSTWKVYMQIADKNGNFNDADKTKASNPKTSGGYGYTVLDGNGLQNAWNYDGNSSTLNFDNDTIKSNTIKNSWWGIPVTKNSTSWYFSLNAQGELNPIATGVTNDIKVRFCGVSANINDSNTGGKVGRWSSVYEIHVDSNIPKYSTAMFRYNSDLASVSSTTNDSALAQKEYVPDMYLKGQWYAYAKITDESSVKVTEVKRGTTKLTYGTDYFVYPEKAGNSGGQSAGSDIKDGENGPYVAYVWIKINPNMTTTQTYTISACDSDGTPNYIYPAFEVNTDNKAPEMTALKDSYDSGAKEIAMTKIRNSNKSVSFSTTATDTGSGFDKLAFYFKRTVGSETTIELPTPKANGSGWENDASSAYVGELTETDSELLADSDANELYGVNLTGTTSGSTFTVTSPADISSYKFIRKGGLIKLSGVYYVISEVSGNAITVAENLTTSPKSAFVAAAMILDHVSTAETPVWNSGVCTIAGDDDGDGFVEYIKKSGATWALQADIFSDLLKDGPVTL